MAIRERHLSFGFESTYATPVTPTFSLECLSENFRLEPIDEDQAVIRSPHLVRSKRLARLVRGDAEVLMGYQEAAYLWYAIMGSVATAGDGPYTHTSPDSNGIAVRPSLTAEVERDAAAFAWRYQGIIITGLALAFVTEQQVRGTISVVGQDEATGTAASDTYTTDDIIPAHLTVNVDGSPVTAMGLNLNVARPVDERIPMRGSAMFAVQPPDAGPFGVAGDFVVREEADLTNYNKFKNAGDVDLGFVCDSGGDETMTLNLNKTRLKQGTPVLDGQNIRVHPYEFVSLLDTVATGSLQSVTVNDKVTVP